MILIIIIFLIDSSQSSNNSKLTKSQKHSAMCRDLVATRQLHMLSFMCRRQTQIRKSIFKKTNELANHLPVQPFIIYVRCISTNLYSRLPSYYQALCNTCYLQKCKLPKLFQVVLIHSSSSVFKMPTPLLIKSLRKQKLLTNKEQPWHQIYFEYTFSSYNPFAPPFP